MSVLSQAQTATKACNWFIFHFCVFLHRFVLPLHYFTLLCIVPQRAMLSFAASPWKDEKTTKKTASFGSPSKFKSSLFLYAWVYRYACCLQLEKCRLASTAAAVMLYTPFLPFHHWCEILLPRDFLHLSSNSSPELVLSSQALRLLVQSAFQPIPLVTLVLPSIFECDEL